MRVWQILSLLISLTALQSLTACATTAATSSNGGTSASPVYDAAPLQETKAPTITNQIVIAEDTDGVGMSWTSVTDNPAMRTATELSNLGGPPAVIGAVTAIVALDAKPRRRAKRTAEAVNGGLENGALDQGFAEKLDAAFTASPTVEADITVQPLNRLRDIPEDAWLVFTDYTLSDDGSALRATARVGHAADYRRALELERERRQQEQMGYSTTSTYRYQAYERERRRRLRREAYRPKYSNSFVYHSDRLILPEPGDIRSDDKRDELEATLIKAFEAERDARYAYADALYAAAIEGQDNPRKLKRAARKRDKAYQKADQHLAKSLEAATDGELDKMERIVLGSAQWHGLEAANNTPPDAALITSVIEEAQAFFAQALATELPGLAVESETESWLERQPTEEQLALGRRIIAKANDDRRIVQILTGERAGVLVSIPDEGTADYGLQSAEP